MSVAAGTRDGLLAVARAQLGVIEGPRPNEVIYNTWYYGKRVSGSAYPWCAAFVSWVADRAGVTGIPRHAYTPSGAAWFQARKQWHTSHPQPGDVVYFRWPTMNRISHVGIVEEVRNDGSIVTIEGNTDSAGGRTGGRTMRQVRRANIAGYGRPVYASGRVATTTVATTLTAIAAALAVGVAGLVALNPGINPDQVLTPQTSITLPPDAQAPDATDPVTIAPTPAPAPVPAPAPAPAPSTGDPAVRAQQEALVRAGFTVGVDGIAGAQTRAATRQLQLACGVKDDGVFGPVTARCAQAVTRAASTSTSARLGTRGAQASDLQRALRAAGYPVSVDGVAGPETIRALRTAQARCSITVDGVFGPASRACLAGPARTITLDRVLRAGATGSDVRAVQRVVGTTADGSFGRRTTLAVERYQRAKGIDVDGVVGRQFARVAGWSVDL